MPSSNEIMSLGVEQHNEKDIEIDMDDVTESLQKPNPKPPTANKNIDAANKHVASLIKEGRQMVKPRSAVWTHFKKVTKKVKVDDGKEVECDGEDDEKSNKCRCNYCGKEYKCNTGVNGTSSLWKHLRACKKKPISPTGQAVLNFGKDVNGETSLASWKFDHITMKRELSLMIMEMELPFKFVEHPRFRNFCKLLQPRYTPISRQTCRREVVNVYDGEKCKLKSLLMRTSQGICITTYTWTSNRGMSYMSITAHFIDDEWKLCKKILNFCPISSHKGEAIGRDIERCLKEWGIKKLLTCTVDNASSNDNLVRWLKSKFSCILEGEYMQMRCVAHIINLIVCDGLKDANLSIVRVREVIKYVRGSSYRLGKFRECVDMEGIQTKSLLSLDVCTRWNSTYFMLDTAEKFENAFARFEIVEPQCKTDLEANRGVGLPTKNDWVTIRRLVVFLRHFYVLTNKVSGTSYVTSSNFFHDLNMLYEVLLDWKSGNDVEFSLMAKNMLEKCDKYWGGQSTKLNKLLFICVILDPRYKLRYVELAIKEMYIGQTGDLVAGVVKGLLYRLFEEYRDTISPPASNVHQTLDVPQRVETNALSQEERIRAKYKRLHSQVSGGTNQTDLDKYLGEGIEQGDDKFNILRWWSFQSARLPILSVMARDLLAIPVSTVASESVFSTGGRVLNHFRSSLTPKIAEALICGSDWVHPSSSTMDIEEEDLEEQEDFETEITKNTKS